MDSEIFDYAAAAIVERGWRRHSGWNYVAKDGALCMEGGLMVALGIAIDDDDDDDTAIGVLWQTPEYKALLKYMKHHDYGSYSALFRYNDTHTEDQVISLLHDAARNIQ